MCALLSLHYIGIPLTIFENAYTTLHYGENIVTAKSILLEFLIGYYVYGTDRYNDAIDYHYHPYNTTKAVMYKNIYKNKIILMMINIVMDHCQ